jgi:hypothetical protein
MRRSSVAWYLALLVCLAVLAAPVPVASARVQPLAALLCVAPHPLTALASLLPPAMQPVTGTALITAIDAQAFPSVNVYVAVNDTTGQHVASLPVGAISLTENSVPIPAPGLSASEKDVGIEAVFAIDTSAAFKTRDANAVTRLDYVRTALIAFGTRAAPRIKDGVDDITLLTPEGILVTHTSQGQAFADALSGYTTSFAGAADPLPLINQALDYASETMPRAGMPRYVVLFSNGLLSKGQAVSLTDVVARALAAQINLYTVYVGPTGTSDSPGGQSLQKLASLTHGGFLVLDKPEALTPLLQHLADQRLQYQLSYRSTLTITGQAAVSTTVTLPDGSQAASNSVTFPLRVEPPTVTFPNLPAILSLGIPSTGVAVTYTVPVAVDFPDGHPRHLRGLELMVDGQVVDTQPNAPLSWNLLPYTTTGSHTLLARVTDELGFVAESAPITITLSFSEATSKLAPTRPPTLATAMVTPAVTRPGPNRWLLILGVGLLLGAVGVAGFWLASRRPRRESKAPAPFEADALPPGEATWPAPPVVVPPAASAAARPASFTLFAKKRAAPAARPQGRAYLEVVEGAGTPRAPIEILGPTLRLGRDGTRAEVVFQDRSVSRLHARIAEEAEGRFRIYDEGSTSGTWVNFTQIPAEGGWDLKPGDMINLGRVQLRFKQRESAKPTPPEQPKLSTAQPRPRSGGEGETIPYRPPAKKGR